MNEGPLGDWLSPENNKNDNTLFWMTYQAYDLKIMSKVAAFLGFKNDEIQYLEQYEVRKKVINQIYLDPISQKSVKSDVRAARMGPLGAAPCGNGYARCFRQRPNGRHTSFLRHTFETRNL